MYRRFLTFAAAASLQPAIEAQQLPPGHVLLGDMVVPRTWLAGDTLRNNQPWNQPPNANMVPYEFHAEVAAADRLTIRDAMDQLETVCGIRFVPFFTGVQDWVYFRNSTTPNTSMSNVGRGGGPQHLWIWPGHNRGVVMHELMHTLSFLHEQQRPDRDNFIQVFPQNIDPGALGQFAIFNGTTMSPYDLASLMHYDLFAYSINSQPTMAPLQPYSGPIGFLQFVSDGDGTGLRGLYGAPPNPQLTTALPSVLPLGATTNQVVTLFGDNFYKPFGSSLYSPTTSGTQVWINGVRQTTGVSVIDGQTIQVQLTPAQLANPGSLAVTVRNPQPGIPTTVSPSLTLSIPAPTTATGWWGPGPNQGFGEALEIAGDVNNDGVREVLVSDGRSVRVMSPVSGSILNTIAGPPSGQQFGMSMVDLGDVNNDGRPDFAFGSPQENLGRGIARIQSGVSPTTTLFTISFTGNGAALGWAMASVDDLTGDQVRELAIGEPGFSGIGNRVHIVNPATGVVLYSIARPTMDSFGQSLAYLGGNLLAIGAPMMPGTTGNQAGRIEVVSLTQASATSVWSLARNVGFERFGMSLAGLDLEGDGQPEVAAAAENIATVFVYSVGNPTPRTFYSGPANSVVGNRMTAISDIDGDGRVDIATRGTDGIVRILSGRVPPPGQTMVVATTINPPTSLGTDFWSGGIAGGRSIFGDTNANLVIGSPNRIGAGSQRGFVTIYELATTSPRLAGCSTSAAPPLLTAASRPVLGTSFQLGATDLHSPAGQLAFAVLGFSGTPMSTIPLGPCTLFLNPASTTLGPAVPIQTGINSSLAIPVPNDVGLLGVALVFQAGILFGPDIDTTNAQITRLGR